jgi:3-methyladenine DNA glycosylase Mpg
VTRPRIGITKAADWPLRFFIAGSPWTSRRGQ